MSLTRKAIGGSIHRIREFELEKVNLVDEFDILQIVGEGWFGKILLTEHRSTQTEMVLKALPKTYTGISDFYREFHYGLHLSAHRNIITTYDVAFETAGFYVFSQEYAPLGDLTSNVTETGLGELHAKRVIRQLAAAIHHIHSRELVHRDIKLDNVLVFKSDFSRIKLCDFGETRRICTPVRRHNEWLPYSPPEVLQVDTDESYKALTVHDVWQFGVVLFVCLTGCLPWQKAVSDDPWYARYQTWHSATLNIAKKPKLFQLISSRAQRMFKRFLDPRPEKRATSVLEVNKYLEDRWLAKLGAEKALNGGADERDELCPSMYSFHSSLEEKNQLLFTLTQYGIETTVNRTEKKDRIREWIRSSAIREENEGTSDVDCSENKDENENDDDDSDDNLNTRGRHFPESRERSKVTVRRNSRTISQTRSTERRNPFAPQVAKERQAIAQSASFPNGDLNLAFKSNDRDTTLDNTVRRFDKSENDYSTENTSYVYDKDRHGQHDRHRHRTKTMPDSSLNDRLLGRVVDESSVTARSKDEPTNSGRSANGTNNSLDTNSSENSVSISLDGSVATHFGPNVATNGIAGPSSFPNEIPQKDSGAIVAKNEGLSTTGPRVPARKYRSQTQASFPITQSPVTSGKSLPARRSRSAKLPLSQAVDANQSASPLTMSMASRLVMQSFNSLQAMNDRKDGGSRPKVEESATYGKDTYGHYGIAQNAVAKVERRPSHDSYTGSGSRSASH